MFCVFIDADVKLVGEEEYVDSRSYVDVAPFYIVIALSSKNMFTGCHVIALMKIIKRKR